MVRQLAAEFAVNDDAGGMLQDVKVAGIVPDDLRQISRQLVGKQGWAAMMGMQHAPPWKLTGPQQMVGLQPGEVKIVQHHHARHPLEHVQHVVVEVRVSEVVEHAVKLLMVVQKPLHGVNRTMLQNPVVIDRVLLLDDDLDVVVNHQSLEQLDGVVTDAALRRRQWRDAGKAWLDC